ncbi:ribosomal RNA small subunit methyltransferase [Mucor ambiguus]|uniref:Ribosomal RNA small subunit methyltransferase n=1 Tax=Mucor ambiguus TaxID=91626 RepID=A0A0C9MIY5_9FUNG|nr:ribosomal RNA small subunit methyltransferase [Mucor ambiguus]
MSSNTDEDDQLELMGASNNNNATHFDVSKLPDSFQKFLQDNSIDPQIYTVASLPRYIRTNTHLPADKRPTLQDLKAQFQTDKVYAVDGLDHFFSVQLDDTTQRISDVPAYKEHAIFGIDLSSAIAVEALEIQKDDQVLDLCCAPGAKLCMIANLLGRDGLGTATGVDLAGHRLATCRSLLKKYKVGEKVRLFEADGTTFSVPPPSRLGSRMIHSDSKDNNAMTTRKRQKMELVKPFWASRLLRFDNQAPTLANALYDKVLVDAECTHDGSIAHILKYEKWGWDTFEKNFMDPHRIDTIAELQCNLMKQGWHMLKPGGIMIYSTCSLSIRQNEDNVAWFLNEFRDAQLEKIPNFDIPRAEIKQQKAHPALQDDIEANCLRFDPISSNTSGFFVARFLKSALFT